MKYSLLRLKRGLSWDRSGLDDEQTQGNGSAMRVAPVGLLYCHTPEQVVEAARLSSIMTHRHPEAVAGAIAIAYLVARAAGGILNPETAIEDTLALLGACRVAENLQQCQALLTQDISTADALKKLGTTGGSSIPSPLRPIAF